MRMEQVIGRYRMQLMAIVEQAPSVREGCRRADIHHSTYYDWLSRLRRDGLEGLVPRSGRTRVMNPTRMRLESEVVALALANPPWGPARLFWELKNRGVPVGSASQVWRILKSHELNTRTKRFRLITTARGLNHAEHTLPRVASPQRRVGRLHADMPGDLVQMDCFRIGTLKEARLGAAKTPGVVWQYTAIDVASSFTWAQIHTTAHNPSAVHTTALAHRVAADLAAWDWHWATCSTDNGNEYRATTFRNTLAELNVTHRFIRAGRPQSNGKVEQVQSTILQECWKPAFIGYTEPSITGLRTDLEAFLTHYNTHRPHTGRWNQGKPPTHIIHPNTKLQP